ncbi:MAG: radical SAM protein [Bacteroidales bacterium]|jgi:histone acetyltransferase (RNA polymerase elongator complex component)
MMSAEKKRHFTIPVFIPMEACPFHCIFCNQYRISGKTVKPSVNEVVRILNQHLSTLPGKNTEIEVGFFGGTFTGLPAAEQRAYLQSVTPFIESGMIQGIRLSTRPDFISAEILSLLKEYPVKTIELGAQSMDDEVLKNSGRGHSSADTMRASAMILKAGFSLGLQMMIGLPGDSPERSVDTAKKIVEFGATETRIYPVIVIRNTPLENLFRKGSFIPLDLEEAIHITKDAARIFDEANVRIIRIGLHPSEGLLNRSDYVAGPFHQSFRELVMTSAWTDRLSVLLNEKPGESITICVNPADLHPAIGYYGKNRKFLERHFRIVKFKADPEIKERTFYVDHH